MRKLSDPCTRGDLLATVKITNEVLEDIIENVNFLKRAVKKLCEIDDEETKKRFFNNCNN